jgi:hypothetical protein
MSWDRIDSGASCYPDEPTPEPGWHVVTEVVERRHYYIPYEVARSREAAITWAESGPADETETEDPVVALVEREER